MSIAVPIVGRSDTAIIRARTVTVPNANTMPHKNGWRNSKTLLLPVPYFLLTFTLPDELRKLARRNQKLIYNLLFRASAAATQQLAQDPRFVGGADRNDRCASDLDAET